MHTRPGNVALSKHVYGYKPAGNISSWAQTLGTGAAKTWAIAYDKADQLEAATQTQSGAITAQQAFRFDRIGNITSKQDGSEISKGTFNNRNQLTAQEPGGWMRVRGTTNEGASVKVKSNANPFTNAATTSVNEFSAWVQAAPGANTVTVEAKDDSPNANTRTQSWSVNITGQSRAPTYDANGNQITGYILPLGSSSLVSCVYSWDAENRLVKITYADNSKTEFTYDGLSRRVRITEKNAGNTITGDKRYLWAGGNQPAEEREANGTTVTKRYFPQGEQRIGGADAGFYYYTKDHLGSVREITNSSGALATRYDFDLWGKRTKLSGSMETDVGFTGHHHHAKSGLILTWFRAYDAEAGTWLSPDPLGESGGMNLYGYVDGNPMNYLDIYGLCKELEQKVKNIGAEVAKKRAIVEGTRRMLDAKVRDIFLDQDGLVLKTKNGGDGFHIPHRESRMKHVMHLETLRNAIQKHEKQLERLERDLARRVAELAACKAASKAKRIPRFPGGLLMPPILMPPKELWMPPQFWMRRGGGVV